MKILVSGGLGYIGSHTVVALSEAGYEVVVVDNLSNTRIEVLDGIESIIGRRPAFYQLDLRNELQVVELFDKEPSIEGVIHFAASKAVGESVENPLLYYENNLSAFIYLLKQLADKPKAHLIFSSSCTVYGEPDAVPISESAPLKATISPYGATKQMAETIIQDVCVANPTFNAVLLRYFNPIGAHPSAQIGEIPQGVPANLVPYLIQTAIGKREQLKVFGADYPTPDGSCIRDYIHVMDLAQAHINSLEFLWNKKQETNCEVFNIGTGKGYSVLELIKTFQEATGQQVNYSLTERRPGDIMQAYANPQKAEAILGWKAQYSLAEALSSAWEWEKRWQQEQSSNNE